MKIKLSPARELDFEVLLHHLLRSMHLHSVLSFACLKSIDCILRGSEAQDAAHSTSAENLVLESNKKNRRVTQKKRRTPQCIDFQKKRYHNGEICSRLFCDFLKNVICLHQKFDHKHG